MSGSHTWKGHQHANPVVSRGGGWNVRKILFFLSANWQEMKWLHNVRQHGRVLFSAFRDQLLPAHFAECRASELVTLVQSPLHQQNKEVFVSPAWIFRCKMESLANGKGKKKGRWETFLQKFTPPQFDVVYFSYESNLIWIIKELVENWQVHYMCLLMRIKQGTLGVNRILGSHMSNRQRGILANSQHMHATPANTNENICSLACSPELHVANSK